jgi:hypothetical protein
MSYCYMRQHGIELEREALEMVRGEFVDRRMNTKSDGTNQERRRDDHSTATRVL